MRSNLRWRASNDTRDRAIIGGVVLNHRSRSLQQQPSKTLCQISSSKAVGHPLTACLGERYVIRTSYRCHGEFGTPDLWHPHAKYPREIGTPKQNTLREFGTPRCTPWGIWHPAVSVQLNRIPANQSLALLNLSEGVSHGKCIGSLS